MVSKDHPRTGLPVFPFAPEPNSPYKRGQSAFPRIPAAIRATPTTNKGTAIRVSISCPKIEDIGQPSCRAEVIGYKHSGRKRSLSHDAAINKRLGWLGPPFRGVAKSPPAPVGVAHRGNCQAPAHAQQRPRSFARPRGPPQDRPGPHVGPPCRSAALVSGSTAMTITAAFVTRNLRTCSQSDLLTRTEPGTPAAHNQVRKATQSRRPPCKHWWQESLIDCGSDSIGLQSTAD